jgi:hypothetical protein
MGRGPLRRMMLVLEIMTLFIKPLLTLLFMLAITAAARVSY